MFNKVRIYYNKNFIIDNTKLNFIFQSINDFNFDNDDPDNLRFASIKKNISFYYDFVDDIQADYFIFPHDNFDNPIVLNKLYQFHDFCKSINKPIYIFYNNDRNFFLNLDKVIFYKTSFFKSTAKNNEFSFPAFSLDFINYYPNKIIKYIVDKNNLSISYCGYIDYLNDDNIFYKSRNILKNIYRIIFYNLNKKSNYKYNIGIVYRGLIIRKLIKNKNITLNFIRRNGFWAKGLNKHDARKEYFENITSSTFALVVRGAGNFSYRFYEVLSAGRIPVILDTDLPLPFDNLLNYHDFCVFINKNDMKNFDKILVEFHKNKSCEDLLYMQKKSRQIFEEYFEPLNFMRSVFK